MKKFFKDLLTGFKILTAILIPFIVLVLLVASVSILPSLGGFGLLIFTICLVAWLSGRAVNGGVF